MLSKMLSRIRNERGETIAESLVTILIIGLVFSFLVTAIVTAAKINATANEVDTNLLYNEAVTDTSLESVDVLATSSGGSTSTITIPVTAYNTTEGYNPYHYYTSSESSTNGN